MDLLDQMIDEAGRAAVPALPRGRRAKPLNEQPVVVGPITPEHFPLLQRPELQDRPLARLRSTHHLAARCLAEGRTVTQTAEISGYTPTRISQLQRDPAFSELVSEYKKEVQERWLGFQERLAALGMAITEEFQERLMDAPENISNEELRRWAETVLDRGGVGPSKTANLNVKSQSATLHLIEMIKQEQNAGTVKLLAAE